MKRNTTKVVLVLLLVSLGAGCNRQQVTNLPPGVSETTVNAWYSATGQVLLVSDVNLRATEAIIALNRSGVFPDGEAYTVTRHSLERIALATKSMVDFLNATPERWDDPVKQKLLGYADDTLKELEAINQNGLLGVKNPDSKQSLSTLLNQIRGALALIKSFS